jgi:hypothetical protein
MADRDTTPHFFIRRKVDGSADSICLHCFRTVATRQDQADLLLCEKQHICSPEYLRKHIHLTKHQAT